MYFSRSGDRYQTIQTYKEKFCSTLFQNLLTILATHKWVWSSRIQILKVLPKEVFEPYSERMLRQPVHPDPLLLPRLRRILPADLSSRETSRGACCCSWTSWAQGLCPVSPGKGREECWSQGSPGRDREGGGTKGSSSMALPSSLPRRPQPPLSSWRWPRTTLDGKCWQ